MSATAVGSPSPSDVASAIQQFANEFATAANTVLASIDSAALDIAKSAIVLLIVLGVILYTSRVSKRLGKELLQGGIILGIFTTFVVPLLMSLHL